MRRPGQRRAAWALALLVWAGCDAAREHPSVGSPGLEPPHGADAGTIVIPPEVAGGGGSGAPQTPPADTPGNPTGSAGAGGVVPPPVGGAGSGMTSADADAGTDLGPGDALFQGLWVIDQPSHALYEATLYELQADGFIATLDTMTLSIPADPNYVTGTVENADRSIRCTFGGRWRTLELRVLELDASCSDGNARAVQLSFPELDFATGVMPATLSVGGQMGWDHRDWPWSFRKCNSRDDCPPF